MTMANKNLAKTMIVNNIGAILSIIKKEVKRHDLPIVTFIAKTSGDPFKVLISTMLSLRTKDLVTAGASERLFAAADTPKKMIMLSEKSLEELIYPVGFYKTKARSIHSVCSILIEQYGSVVPSDIDTLVQLPGVGRKTANLVLILGFKKPAICVDTHVHRISNIWGFVKTNTPLETEMELREKLPKRYWLEYNDLLVSFGQHLCVPVSPKCSRCPIAKHCPRIGVTKSR